MEPFHSEKSLRFCQGTEGHHCRRQLSSINDTPKKKRKAGMILNVTCIVDHWSENVFPLESKQATFTTYFIVCKNASWRDPSRGLNIFIQKSHLSHSKLYPWEQNVTFLKDDITAESLMSFDWNVTATHYQKEQTQGHKFIYTDLWTKNSVMTQSTKATN